MRVGVVGYSGSNFDLTSAQSLLREAFSLISKSNPTKNIVIISGLTNLGIPRLGYLLAQEMGWKTVGIACSLARDYERFPVDFELIEGHQWGDESTLFLESIDLLVRVGGGAQSMEETKRATEMRIPCIEFDLPKL